MSKSGNLSGDAKKAGKVNKHGDSCSEVVHLCGDCELEVIEGNKALCCEVCDIWFHIQCQNIPETIYTFIFESEEGDQFLWCCKFCKRGGIKLHSRMRNYESKQSILEERQENLESVVTEIKDEITEDKNKNSELATRVGDVEARSTRTKEMVDKNSEDNEGILGRLGILEAKVMEQEGKVVSSSENGSSRVVEPGNIRNGNEAGLSSNSVLIELNERRNRENNIVVYGAAETNTALDRTFVLNLMRACELEVEEEQINSVGRLGKSVQGREKARPMLVKFANGEIKKCLFKNLRKLKGKHEYDVVRIAHDLTRRERDHEAALWMQAKNLEAAGKGKHLVRGPPWNRRVVKATGDRDQVPTHAPNQGSQGMG